MTFHRLSKTFIAVCSVTFKPPTATGTWQCHGLDEPVCVNRAKPTFMRPIQRGSYIIYSDKEICYGFSCADLRFCISRGRVIFGPSPICGLPLLLSVVLHVALVIAIDLGT